MEEVLHLEQLARSSCAFVDRWAQARISMETKRMYIAQIRVRNNVQRVQGWISNGLPWVLCSLFFSSFFLMLAVDQAHLGPDFKRALVACFTAGLASAV